MRCYFGSNLKRIRQEKKMSIYVLASMVNCDASNISRWENSKKYPQVIWVYRLANALEVNPEELIRVAQ